MTDITLRGEVSKRLRSQITFACCLAGAWQAEEYISLLERIGFQSHYIEDYSYELVKVAYQLGITFGSIDNFLGKVPAGPCQRKEPVDTTPTSIESYHKFVRLGKPGYALVVMTKM
ncbi:hypothetical protein ACFLV4_04600 [Chloroflexota bacterium]